MTSNFDLRTVLLSTLGISSCLRTSELVDKTGASRDDVLKALRHLQGRNAIRKGRGVWNGTNYSAAQRDGAGGQYTDALWVNCFEMSDRFADLAMLDTLVKERGNLWTKLDASGFVAWG